MGWQLWCCECDIDSGDFGGGDGSFRIGDGGYGDALFLYVSCIC
jgi:hypothetical protein